MKNAIIERRIVIVGAGVAGLVCATVLADKGYRVIVVEARKMAGGRTRSFVHSGTKDEIDNGQHILMGCYVSTLKWLDRLGTRHLVQPPKVPPRFIESRGAAFEFRMSLLPAPFHAFVGLLRFKALTWQQRLETIRVARSLKGVATGMTVKDWLRSLGQNEQAVRWLWGPLCVAVMNEEPAAASAKLFANALRLMLFDRAAFSTLLIPTVGLSKLFVEPAIVEIEGRGGRVVRGTAVTKLNTEGFRIKAVGLSDGTSLDGDGFIFAVPPWKLSQIEGFEDAVVPRASAIVSSYLWLDGIKTGDVVPNEMTGCVDGPIHWIFRKNDTLLQITISAANKLAALPIKDVERMVTEEFLSRFPVCRGKIGRVQVIKERQATMMSADADQRPGTATRWSNGFLAGDWIDTGLPYTIESAVRSGYAAAKHIEMSQQTG